MKNSIISIGEIGLYATEFFITKHKSFFDCALILSSREGRKFNITNYTHLEKISKKGDLLILNPEDKDSTKQLKLLLKKFSNSHKINLVLGLSETFSAKLSIELLDFLKHQSVEVQIFGVFPFPFEGKKKISYAERIISNLNGLGGNLVVYGGNENPIKVKRKESVEHTLEMVFKKIVIKIKSQKIQSLIVKTFNKIGAWLSDVFKIALGVFLGGLGLKISYLILVAGS